MKSISTFELLQKMDLAGPHLKLVNALDSSQFDHIHLPGSINLRVAENPAMVLDKNDDIVVHCTNGICPKSRSLYERLRYEGYPKLHHYAGGLEEWEKMRLPLEGNRILKVAC